MTNTLKETPASRLWVALGRTHVNLQRYSFTMPLTVLTETVKMEGELAQLQAEMVKAARSQGASWAVIGDALGITRQAAQKRYDK